MEYIPVKCFTKFVQSAFNARREGDENPNSSVVAETMKLLANSSYGYQIVDRSRHTVTKYLRDEKTHGAINTKLLKRLHHVNDQLFEEYWERQRLSTENQSLLGSSYSNTLNLECWSFTTTFSERFCDVDKFEELEMDTDSLYLALSEKEFVRLHSRRI